MTNEHIYFRERIRDEVDRELDLYLSMAFSEVWTYSTILKKDTYEVNEDRINIERNEFLGLLRQKKSQKDKYAEIRKLIIELLTDIKQENN
jgi:hypothetical protein